MAQVVQDCNHDGDRHDTSESRVKEMVDFWLGDDDTRLYSREVLVLTFIVAVHLISKWIMEVNTGTTKKH